MKRPSEHAERDQQYPRPSTRSIATGTATGFLAFGLGSGLSPRAPGTVGTLAGLLVALPVAGLGVPMWAALSAIGLAFLVGIPICTRASNALGVHDHGGIVWDEFVGIWLVLATVPFGWSWWLAAFIAFRVFDIIKPWPIGWLDRKVHGGLGIMIDDVVAAGFAIGVLAIVQVWI